MKFRADNRQRKLLSVISGRHLEDYLVVDDNTLLLSNAVSGSMFTVYQSPECRKILGIDF